MNPPPAAATRIGVASTTWPAPVPGVFWCSRATGSGRPRRRLMRSGTIYRAGRPLTVRRWRGSGSPPLRTGIPRLLSGWRRSIGWSMYAGGRSASPARMDGAACAPPVPRRHGDHSVDVATTARWSLIHFRAWLSPTILPGTSSDDNVDNVAAEISITIGDDVDHAQQRARILQTSNRTAGLHMQYRGQGQGGPAPAPTWSRRKSPQPRWEPR